MTTLTTHRTDPNTAVADSIERFEHAARDRRHSPGHRTSYRRAADHLRAIQTDIHPRAGDPTATAVADIYQLIEIGRAHV